MCIPTLSPRLTLSRSVYPRTVILSSVHNAEGSRGWRRPSTQTELQAPVASLVEGALPQAHSSATRTAQRTIERTARGAAMFSPAQGECNGRAALPDFERRCGRPDRALLVHTPSLSSPECGALFAQRARRGLHARSGTQRALTRTARYLPSHQQRHDSERPIARIATGRAAARARRSR